MHAFVLKKLPDPSVSTCCVDFAPSSRDSHAAATFFLRLKLQQRRAIQANNKKKTNSRKHCLFMFNSYPEGRVLFVVFVFFFPPNMFTTTRRRSLFLSQLALRAPSSLSRGQDYVSSVHSTVAPPSRLPHSAAVATAITAATWTKRRTCAPVSHSLFQ